MHYCVKPERKYGYVRMYQIFACQANLIQIQIAIRETGGNPSGVWRETNPLLSIIPSAQSSKNNHQRRHANKTQLIHIVKLAVCSERVVCTQRCAPVN